MADEIKPAAEVTTTPAADKKTDSPASASAPAAVAAKESDATKTAEATSQVSKVDDKKPDAASPESKTTEQTVVPEKFELKLAADSLLNQGDVDQVTALAKEHGLSNVQAQKVLEARQADRQAQVDAHKQLSETWRNQALNDPEIGGKNLEENVKLAKRMVDTLPESAKKFLDDSGLGNHPEAIRIFSRFAKMDANDKLVTEGKGGSVPREKKSVANNLYGKTHNKQE